MLRVDASGEKKSVLELTSKSDSILLKEDSVVSRDLVGLVGEKGELEIGSESTLLSGKVGPSKMRAGGGRQGGGSSVSRGR